MKLQAAFLSTLKGTGKVKGSGGKPALPKKKKPKVVSTSQYKSKGYK